MPAHVVEDKVGKRYGRLVVLRYVGNSRWLCKCDCGNETTVCTSSLNRGATQSCGCLHKERASLANKTHGHSKTRLYNIWAGIKERCTNPNATNYKNYGGRGISMCAEWLSDYMAFEQWAISNGYDEAASGHQCSIDRIDNDGDYCPSNCQWTTYSEQARNRRACRKPRLWRAVEQIDEDGNVLAWFPSIRDAMESTGLSRTNITGVCTGRRHSTFGTYWRYAQPIVQTERGQGD